MSIRAGMELSLGRLREPGSLSAGLLACCFELGVALLELAQGRIGAPDRALTGGAFGLALPLLVYFLAGKACAGTGLRAAVHPLARHGLRRNLLVIGLALPVAALAAVFASTSGVMVVLVTRGPSDPLLLRDALSCLWIGAVAGSAYALAFVGASAFGRNGRGRIWLLLADFLLGAGSSFLALPWPKAHVRNLLGGMPVLELSQPLALLFLLGTSFAFLGSGLARSGR